jgi:hypothetical protein
MISMLKAHPLPAPPRSLLWLVVTVALATGFMTVSRPASAAPQ